ncbi:MAG: hypothetical protein A2560_04460 [Bdellovibrionales bacterium RIFOXYD1_FULL_39_84]|nr:MAG: hypothetical protein A2560_04460 [Bdellovibrionales bacterium RIFOXYD1_FULL_39_84]
MQKFIFTKIDQSTLAEEILEFGPMGCMECEFEGNIPMNYFLVKPDINSEKEYNELKKEIKKQLGFESFTEVGSDLGGLLISVCKCPRCGSKEIFQDV